MREARQRGHPFLGSEHVLLGILSEPDCIAAKVLADLGVADAARQLLTGVMNLREELLRRREREQAPMRQMRVGQPVDPDLTAQLDATTRDNTAWLGGVIQEWGWPGRSLVGDDGADAAWLLAQHSDQDPAFQRTSNLAYLTDRVLLKERGTQVYGTQFTSASSGPEPQPIEDPGGVDERRAAMGLGPLAEYAELMRGQR